MDKECYFLRHKIKQELFVYLEIGETWEESFFMEFKITDDAPHSINSGSLYENRHTLIAFKYIAITDIKEILKDKKLEWMPIEPDAQLKFSAKTFVESFV